MPRGCSQGQGEDPTNRLFVAARRLGSGRCFRTGFRPGCAVVECALEHLTGTEGKHPARGNFDLLASLRIASNPCLLVPNLKVAEAGNLDLVPALQRFLDRIE